MGIPVVIKPSGGMPVTVSPYGTPMTEASNGFGIAVTQAPNGLPVAGITFGPTLALSASSVPETAAVNTTVGTLSVTSGTTGTPVYSLTDSAGGKFNISGALLRTNALLDYETATFHNVTVAVSGVTPAVANRVFTISVTDVAEPVIVLTGTTVNEDAAVNTTVGTLSIANTYTGTPVYTLTDDAGGKFNISGALLRTNAALDYETATTHSVTVAVTGITPAAANKAFTVVVLDVEEVAGAGTWNPLDKSAVLTLSPDNLTAIGGTTGADVPQSVRATVSQSAGKRFCRFTCVETTGWAFNGGLQVGFLPASAPLAAGIGGTGGAGYLCHGYVLQFDGRVTSSTMALWDAGNTIDMALDLTAKKVWFRVGSGGWNNDILANQDPAGGVGGIDVAVSIDGTTAMFPACAIRASGPGVGEISIDLSGTGAPAGFLPWGSAAAGTTKNIVTDYGAVGDGEWVSATLSITAGGNVLTASTALWVAGDVGKGIVIGQIGGGGNCLVTTITAVGGGGTQVTLAHPATGVLSSTPGIITCWGTNNADAFDAFRDAYQGQTVTLTIPAGIYCIAGRNPGLDDNFGGLWDGIRNITVNATGATICGGLFQIMAAHQYQDTTHSARTVSVTAGATAVTLTTPSQVTRFVPGNYAMMTGFDLMIYGGPTNHQLFEFLRVTAIDNDSGSPTYGKVTFATPLVNSYLSTWPHYSMSGLDYGGPATLFAMNPNFDHTSVVNNLTVVHHQQWSMAGKNLTFNNCTFHGFEGNSGPHPTMAVSVVMNNCVASNITMEIDKQVTNFEMNGCAWGGLAIQSASVKTMILDNTDITYSIIGTPQNTIIRNGSSIGTLVPGPIFGHAVTLDVRDSAMSSFGSTTYHGSGYEIRSGDGSNDGIQTDFPIEDGVITVPASMRNNASNWAVLGGKIHLYDPNVGSIGLFTITAVTQSAPGGDIIIATNMTLDDWPSRSYSPSLGLWLLTHSCPDCTFVDVSGCPEVDTLSSLPAHTPLHSRFYRSFDGSLAVGRYWQLHGRIKKVVVAVTTAYSGPTGVVTATLSFGNATVKMSDYSDLIWNPVINLKTTGTRTFDVDADPYPTAWTGGVAGDTLTGMSEAQWATSNFRVLMTDITGEAVPATTRPVFTVEVICDQGF